METRQVKDSSVTVHHETNCQKHAYLVQTDKKKKDERKWPVTYIWVSLLVLV